MPARASASPISKAKYKLTLTPWQRFLNNTSKTVTGSTILFILSTRSLGAVYFAAGASLCSLTAKALKHVLREARPVHTTYKVTYGLPSTHSATIFFFATYITLSSLYIPAHPSLSFLPRWVIVPMAPLLAIPTAATIATSRIWLGHHTIKQVLAGVFLGVTMALGWFYGWTHGVKELCWAWVEVLPAPIPDLVQ